MHACKDSDISSGIEALDTMGLYNSILYRYIYDISISLKLSVLLLKYFLLSTYNLHVQ